MALVFYPFCLPGRAVGKKNVLGELSDAGGKEMAHRGRDGAFRSIYFTFGATECSPFCCVYHSRREGRVLDGWGAWRRRLTVGGEAADRRQ